MTSGTPSSERTGLWALITGARTHERRVLAIAFLYFFCVLAAYYVLRPVRDQFAAAVGPTNLWQFWAGVFVATLVLAPVFGALVARYRREVFVPAVNLFAVVCLALFIPAFAAQDVIGLKLLGTIFYIWLSVFSLFVVSVFWSFMADVFDSAQARRLFPVIAVGGTLGAVAGPTIAALLPIHTLLLIAIGLMLIATACAWMVSSWSRQHPNRERSIAAIEGAAANDEIIGGSIWSGLLQTLHSPFLRRMAALMVLGDAVGTVAYVLAADYIKIHYADAEARKTVYAHIDLITNLLQLGLQLSLTRLLMLRWGSGVTLVVAGATKAIALIATAFVGPAAVLPMLVATRSSFYGIGKPAADSLYARADRELRYKGKNVIDTAVWRFGDVVVSLAMKGLYGIGIGVAGFALLSMIAAALEGVFGWRSANSRELRDEHADATLDAAIDAPPKS